MTRNIARISAILLILLAASLCAQPQSSASPERTTPMPATATPAQSKAIATELFEQCFNENRTELLPQIVAAEYQGPRGQSGPASFAATLHDLRASFPDLRYTIDDLVAENDRVVVRWHWNGDHTGPFRNFPPSHKRVTASGISIFQIEDGKITHAWLQLDQLGFLQQIGVLPEQIAPPAQSTQQPAQK